MRRTSLFIQLLCLAFVALCLTACRGRQKKPKVERVAVAVELLELQETNITEQLALTGDVLPWEKLGVNFKVGGRIDKLHVEEGQALKAGTLIAELDERDYKLVRDLAKSQVDALEPHLKRARKLKASEVVPESTLEELESRYKAAKLQLSQAQAQLSYAKLYAPMDGTVLRRMVAVGDMVGVERPVIALVQMDRVKITLPVAQKDLPKFEIGQKVQVTAPGLTGMREGKVHQIGLAADVHTRTLPVEIEVDNHDLALRAGMLATVTVSLGERHGIFAPVNVLNEGRRDTMTALVLPEGSENFEERTVEVGRLYGDQVEIRAGLKVGDKILLKGIAYNGDLAKVLAIWRNGERVEPIEAPAKPADDEDEKE